MQDFADLKVWQKCHRLTVAIYQVTAEFPQDEKFGLARQIRRAASSIGANIAEGCARDAPRDFARFLQIAAGSASELENHLLLARDLGFLTPAQRDKLSADLAEVRRVRTSLIQKVRSSAPAPTRPHPRSTNN